MLRFVLGKSGTGKTTLINNKICDLVSSGCNKIMLIVPDQSTFETEKDFLDLLGAKDSKKVLVFGFSRLCRYVFELTGNFRKNVIDNGTRAVVMSLALEQLSEKLKLLKPRRSRSVVDAMLQTVSDLKKNSVSADALRLVSEQVADETLKSKLCETALTAETFDALVAQSYIDPLDDLTRLFNILSEKNIFEGYTVFYDGFSGFTVQQLRVIRLLMSQCLDTYFSLTLDPVSDGREDVFATSHATYKILKEYAKRDGVEIKAPIKTSDSQRFKSNELKAVENGIFRNDYETVSGTPADVMVYCANDAYSECEFVARQIKKLVIEKGYLYSEISVICHETTPYKGILNEALKRYDIPYFMDVKSDVEVKPVIRLVNSVFRAVTDDFERDDILAVLKTGLTDNTVDEISIFENYVFVWNINRSAFKSEFTQNPRGFSESFSEADKENLYVAEKVRKSLVEPLIKFKENTKEKNGTQISELLYNLLVELGAPDALRRMYSNFERTNEKQTGAEQIKIWNMFVDILDKMAAVTGSGTMTAARYYELLSFQISAMQLSDIPQTIDSVTVTTAQRVRVSKQRASFLIGCIDGVFPASPHTSGIFSPYELRQLVLNDITLADDFSDLANLETFMAYCCMTSSSEKLCVSYPISDLKGGSHKPSVIISEIVKIFPDSRIFGAEDFDAKKESMLALKPAFDEYSKSLSPSHEVLNSLGEFFEQNPSYNTKLESIKRAVDKSPFAIEKPENAEKLFGENLKISASQIEKFNKCRFAYFCNYGLNIRERRKAEINPMEYGTLVHYILERFFSAFTKPCYSQMSDQDITAFVTETLNEYINNYFGGEDRKTRSFMYRLSVLNSNVSTLLRHIVDEMSQSDFDAVDCELKIGGDIPAYTIELPDNHTISVCGSIDRVDLMEKDGERYLRVIDYKTGAKTFRLSDILYGINLQMLLYLCSVQKSSDNRYGNVIPCGILYVPANVPLVKSEKNEDISKADKKINDKLRMNGLLLNDASVFEAMDKTSDKKYIKIAQKAKGASVSDTFVTLEEFGKIFRKIDNLIIQMGTELYSGQIAAAPLIGAHDGCEYCPYDSVCGYRKSEGIKAFNLDNSAVIEKITEELERKEAKTDVTKMD